ncbi:MAG: hypothetical protein IPK73_01340 [Candidatus Obscuribacter sp.]|nr:hypothetical protein [Candidatus Obscuribacter sp.]MBK9280355.1 hypothetical protein [Candidatus Obscuribacter sp.]
MKRKTRLVKPKDSLQESRLEKLLRAAELGLHELAEATRMQLEASPTVNSNLLMLATVIMALEGIRNRLEQEYISACPPANEDHIDNFYSYTDEILHLCRRALEPSGPVINREEWTGQEFLDQFTSYENGPAARIAVELETYVVTVRMLFQLVWEDKQSQAFQCSPTILH